MHSLLLSCVLETVQLFQTCGLRTSLIVCDGSPANLTTIKLSHRHSGAYSVISDSANNDIYESFQPSMANLLDGMSHSPGKIFKLFNNIRLLNST